LAKKDKILCYYSNFRAPRGTVSPLLYLFFSNRVHAVAIVYLPFSFILIPTIVCQSQFRTSLSPTIQEKRMQFEHSQFLIQLTDFGSYSTQVPIKSSFPRL